jgi:tripeptidyl-peptidase I
MTSVGATYIENTSEEKEVGIYFSSGGFSEIFDQPDYQRDAVLQFLNRTKTPSAYFNQNGRGFPDVGAVGEGFQVILHGKESEGMKSVQV